jgi:hypothetical protein
MFSTEAFKSNHHYAVMLKSLKNNYFFSQQCDLVTKELTATSKYLTAFKVFGRKFHGQ